MGRAAYRSKARLAIMTTAAKAGLAIMTTAAKAGLKAQKCIAQGNALGGAIALPTPCKGKSLKNHQSLNTNSSL